MNVKDLLYSLACLSFAVVIGGAVYEHLAVVPQWSAAPPASLSMFQGEYGLKAGAFWMYIHPITLLLMMANLIFSWKYDRRKHILFTFTGYVMILIITALYFVPELIQITGTPFSQIADPALTHRAKLWELFSIIRLLVLIMLAIGLSVGLTKVASRRNDHKIIHSAAMSPTANSI